MLVGQLHKEDIKAALRKRHGTLGAFAASRDLKPQAVVDWLRGRTSDKVAQAVEAELRDAERDHEAGESMNVDDSAAETATHRLNAGAR